MFFPIYSFVVVVFLSLGMIVDGRIEDSSKLPQVPFENPGNFDNEWIDLDTVWDTEEIDQTWDEIPPNIPAQEEDSYFPPEDSFSILDGSKENRPEAIENFAYLSVKKDGEPNPFICTGFLVGKCLVTAAHCLKIDGKYATSLSALVNGKTETIKLDGASHKIHPKYKHQNATHDIAVIRTGFKGTFTIDNIEKEKLKEGTEVFIDGYGQTIYGKSNPDKKLYRGSSYFVEYSSKNGGPKTILTMSRAKPNSKYPVLMNLAAGGDSGGPAFILNKLLVRGKIVFKYSLKIVGVASSVDTDRSSGKDIPYLSHHASFYDADNYEFLKSNLSWCATEPKLDSKAALTKYLEQNSKNIKNLGFYTWFDDDKDKGNRGEVLRSLIIDFLKAERKIEKGTKISYQVKFLIAPVLQVYWHTSDKKKSGDIFFDLVDPKDLGSLRFRSSRFRTNRK